ncbi:MAG: GldG family protein [Clostridia bacterium]|nr:GldG family protein [Clostridia bacterium]
MNRNSFFNSRQFKYGSVATVFTVAFVAIVIIFNIIFTALANRYMWYIDMTEQQVYTLSEEAKEIMSDITEDVWIHFASEPDELMNGTNSSYTRYIYTTALQLEEEFPNVHVDAVSVLKNPSYFREYYNTTATDIDTTSVVITTEKETRVVRAQAFFTFNDTSDLSTVWAYSGEKRMISNIMQVTQTETPIVAFTTQHGEDIGGATTLAELFADNGFTVTAVDLSHDTIDDDCRILVIFNPLYDFLGAEADSAEYNEIEKIDKFLDRYGCLLVFAEPGSVSKLTNLNEFLEEWGIAYVPDTMIKDEDHAMSVDGYKIVAEYQRDTLGGSIYADLNDLATPPKTVIYKSAPIDILWEQGGGLSGTRDVSPVLKSYDTSVLVKDGMVGEQGSYNLMVVSRESRIVDNEYYYSYVIAAGSPTFASKSNLDSNAYANDDVLSAAMKAVGRERVLAALTLKPFDKDEITVTTAEANRWTVAMTTVIPAIFAIVGLVVITRRKHS